jgi:hypothetical protein
MPKHIASFVPTLSVALLAAVTLISLGSGVAHPAGNCLTEPNLQAGQRGYWYYRIDRSTRRKCWYLGPQRMKVRRAPQSTARLSPIPISRPAIDTRAEATAGEKTETGFSARWSAALEGVRSIGSETVSRPDAEPDERSETASRNDVAPISSRTEASPISPVLADGELAAAQRANRHHMPELLGTVLAFAAVFAFAVIVWTMFARGAIRLVARRHLLDRSAKLPNPTVRIEETRTGFASAVTASPHTETEPEPASDPSSERLRELKEIHRQLEELEPNSSSEQLQELKEIHRHLEELLGLLQGPERTAA